MGGTTGSDVCVFNVDRVSSPSPLLSMLLCKCTDPFEGEGLARETTANLVLAQPANPAETRFNLGQISDYV